MKLTFLNVLISGVHGAVYQGQVRRGSAPSALSQPVPSPAANGHRDDFADELLDQMRKPGEDMFEEVCKPLCKKEQKDGGTDSVEIEIDRSMWEKPSAPASSMGAPGLPPDFVVKRMYPNGPPPGFYFQSSIGAKLWGSSGVIAAKGYEVGQVRPVNATFIDSEGKTTEFGSAGPVDEWSEQPPKNLPGKLRLVFSVLLWANTCSPYGCKDSCMDYSHFIQYCRTTLRFKPPVGLPYDTFAGLFGGTDQKCVRGEAADAGCSVLSHRSDPRCFQLGCEETCTVFKARSTEEVCACDAAYLAVPKSKEEQDNDCLKPETFYKLTEGHDVFGYAAKYVSENIRREDQATFDVLDKNHDGFITREEAVGSLGYSPLHSCADVDKDGMVSQGEYKEKTHRGIASCMEVKQAFETRCKSFDDNKDGQISYGEWLQHHQDPVHIYTVNSTADWEAEKVARWWGKEVNVYGNCPFTPRRGIMVDAQNQVLELHGAMRADRFGAFGPMHNFGNASLDKFERMMFPLQYRYTEPYGLCRQVPDPSGMNDVRSPECIDTDSNGIIEMSECRAMQTEERQIVSACSQCTHWIDRADAAEDLVLTAAEASQCRPEIASNIARAKKMGQIPVSAPLTCSAPGAPPGGTNMAYWDFRCHDTNQDLRLTVDECKEVGRQRFSMPHSMTPGAWGPKNSEELRKWSDDYFKWKAERPSPAPVPNVFLHLKQAPPSPAAATPPSPAVPGRPQTYMECASQLGFQSEWPAQFAGGSPAPAPSMMPSDLDPAIMDRNGDGKVSRQEAYDYAASIPGGDIVSTKVDKLFKDADLDGDNFITADEYKQAGVNHQGDGKHQ